MGHGIPPQTYVAPLAHIPNPPAVQSGPAIPYIPPVIQANKDEAEFLPMKELDISSSICDSVATTKIT